MVNLFEYFQWWSLKRTLKSTISDRNRSRQQPELGRITGEDLDSIIKEVEKQYIILKETIPPQKTLGSRLMVKNGAASLALYRAIKEVVEGEDYATELCTDVLWKLYKNQVKVQRFIAHLLYKDPQKQMNMCQQIFLRFPLSSPGYECKLIKRGDSTSYDILKCPVYDYYNSLGREELEFFRNSWCTLDFPLAEYLVTGGKYERRHALSKGDDKCDMRWKTN